MKTVCLLSGGLDSTVLCVWLLREGHEVEALSVNYGQRHSKELIAAAAIAEVLRVPHRVVDLSGLKILLRGSSLTSDDVPVPEGHYADESMKATVVPNRNAIMLSVAMGAAVACGARSIAIAAHAGDHPIYPDCRQEFVDAMREVGKVANYSPIGVLSPFVHLSKGEVCRIGAEIGAPMHLSWSCYKGGVHHCGKCGTCVERREAFVLAGVADPTVYDE